MLHKIYLYIIWKKLDKKILNGQGEHFNELSTPATSSAINLLYANIFNPEKAVVGSKALGPLAGSVDSRKRQLNTSSFIVRIWVMLDPLCLDLFISNCMTPITIDAS